MRINNWAGYLKVLKLINEEILLIFSPLTQPIRRTSVSVTATDELDVRSQPQHWPGVDSLIKLLNRESLLDNTPPNLRLLLVEFFSTIFLSTFLYAFTFYDSRLLYRLAAHPIGNQMFGEIFGGGGEHKLKSAIPVRPPRNLKLILFKR